MPAKITLPNEKIEEICQLFSEGVSIPEIMQLYNLGRNKVTEILRQWLGERYKKCARRIIASSGAKAAVKLRGRSNPHTPEWNARIGAALRGRTLSDETRAKIGEMSRTRHERGTWTKEQHATAMQRAIETKRNRGYFELHGQRHSEWMLINAPMRGKKMTEESRKKMSEAKKQFFESGGSPSQLGVKRTQEQRDQVREHTKCMWADGKFTWGDAKNWRSKLEITIFEEFQRRFPDTQHSFRINDSKRTYVFDVYVPSLNLLVEVNGDYWHLNPFLYVADHIDEHRNVTARGVWEADALKYQAAVDLGYKVNVLWESSINALGVTESVTNVVMNHV